MATGFQGLRNDPLAQLGRPARADLVPQDIEGLTP